MLLALGATALALATAMGMNSLVSTLLAAYIVAVGEAAALTTALSPLRLVTRTGLAIGELVVLSIALWVWHRRGRPGLPLSMLRVFLNEVRSEPAAVVLLLGVAAALLYELVLVLTAAPNNWDSLTYHLPRVAAWVQHGGVYWIPNAPTDRLNEFQPLAEQEILFLFVTTGEGALFALPQFVAELAIIVAIFGSARRIGFDLRQSACAALFFATLPLVALEATTAQNDLVAASLPAVAVTLLLGTARADLPLAGIAVALGLGVKLTTALVLPVPALLAFLRGRHGFRAFTLSAASAFVLVGMWGFVLNLAKTGHVLGHGGGRIEQQASPSLIGSPTTAFRVVFRLFDLSGYDTRLLIALAILGLVLGGVTLFAQRRKGNTSLKSATAALLVALPLLAPRLVPSAAHAAQVAANAVSLPVNAASTTGGQFFWSITYQANEDVSSFGPLGGPALLLASLLGIIAAARRRTNPRLGVIALALPLFIVLLSLSSKYNPWLSRFMIVPIALAAPLLGAMFRRRNVSISIIVVAILGLFLVHLRNQIKPFHSHSAYAWDLTQVDAIRFPWEPGAAAGTAALDRVVPPNSCLGAALSSNEPAYVLFGPQLSRRIRFLPRRDTVGAARREHTTLVLIGDIPATAFHAAGWHLYPLPNPPRKPYWTLAVAPSHELGASSCRKD